jgi:PadR family transcriptional regulator PadR
MSTRAQSPQPASQIDLLQGTLDLLILQTLARGKAHGHAIARNIEQRSEDVLQVGHGSLYPARFYRLTAKGRKQLFAETSKWQKFSTAIAQILAPIADENA